MNNIYTSKKLCSASLLCNSILCIFLFIIVWIALYSSKINNKYYTKALFSLQPHQTSFTPYFFPNIIWLFWDGNIPDSNRYLLHNLKEKLDNYSLIFLCNTTVFNYVDIKQIPPNLYTIQKANQVDYYRFILLYYYGGVWLDSSTYFSSNSLVNTFISTMKKKKSLMGAFNYRHHPNYHIEVGIIFAPRKSPFIKRVIEEMELSVKIGRRRYIKRRITQGVEIKSPTIVYKRNENMKYEEYLCVYVCILTVLQEDYQNKANIELLRAEDYMYKLHELCKWDIPCMNRLWHGVDEIRQYPVTKFNHYNRDYMDFPKVDII